jgi:hypothetical protein
MKDAFWRATWQDPINLFTLVLAIATTVLVIVAIFQSWIGANRTAQRAAAAAEDSTKISKEALISVQRAFVFIKLFETHVINNEFNEFLIMPMWENSGSTVANSLKNWVNFKVFPGEPPNNYDYPDLDRDGQLLPGQGEGLSMFIGPHATQYADTLAIPVPIMEEVRAGKLRLFVWGWAEYCDVFEGIPLHRTEFCNEVIVTAMGRDEATGKVTSAVRFSIYGPHNSAK